jgi:hypothetical protein
MINKKLVLTIIIVLLLILSMTLLFVLIMSNGKIEFDASVFFTELFKFVLGVITLGISFWLVNVFWSEKQKQDRINHSRRIIKHFYHHLIKLISQCNELFAMNFLESERKASDEQDQKIIEIIRSLRTSIDNALFIIPEIDIMEDSTLSETLIESYWAKIVPAINKLNTINTIRCNSKEIMQQLEVISHASESAIHILETDFKK